MSSSKRFGTFEGVFTPTILTILGAIMYLRLGWVVGNAGFGGALVIILLAKLVTVTTGLAIASMASNIKIGAGGSYAIISRSLGLEIGGAIGIPLYLSQALGAAMYIIGFTEGWLAIFPQHDPFQVASVVLVLLLTLSLISAKVAMKVQYIIMFLIISSLISFFMGKGDGVAEISLWGDSEAAPFWTVFAIFFPAVTGIEAGAAMSGDLKDPKRSLSVGLLSSIALSFVVYVALAFWMDYSIPAKALRSNYTIMIDAARWEWIVVAALLGATLSSALGSIIGGPRTLMALGQHRVVPLGKFLAQQSKNGEPRFAIVTTGVIIELGILLGDLNTIAPLLTMFFLITYGTINMVVFIEKKIGITSYRPSFDIPLIIPLIGTLWCGTAMFLINPLFGSVAVVIIILVYLWQIRLGHQAPWGDVRSGIFVAIAEWAVRMTARMPASSKSWKPNVVVPVEEPGRWHERIKLVRNIVFPKGSVRAFSVRILERGIRHRIGQMVDQLLIRSDNSAEPPGTSKELKNDLATLINPLKEEGILTSATVIEANHFIEGISVITQSFKGMPLPPNVMFLTMSEERRKDQRLEQLLAIAVKEELGIIVLRRHPKEGFRDEKIINLWMRGGSPNRNLSILTALQLERNWNGTLRLVRMVAEPSEFAKASKSLQAISRRGRLPLDTENVVVPGRFPENFQKIPMADLNIFGMPMDLEVDTLHEIATAADTACLFIKDSGHESALV
ncbi:MAG: amino acid permease [Candidatus Marinimicrobia bacterium]|jgi:amino acid transporter|nr:amino acid permease [Candidatus Neomarinimicrobiota bacterium]